MFKLLCYMYLKLTGWKYVNAVPKDLKRYVVIGLPHTSNWDFILAMAYFWKSKIKGKFTIKKQWTRGIFRPFMKSLGAMGVDREAISKSGHMNMTDYMASLITKADEFVMVVTPEGTRKATGKWKTGFYHTAKKAGVPIGLGFADYKRKVYGIEKIVTPSDEDKDFKEIGSYYASLHPKHPENFCLDDRFKA